MVTYILKNYSALMFKKFGYRRKKKDVLFCKKVPLFSKNLKKLKKPTIFMQLRLPNFNVTKLDLIEKRNVLIIHRKLCYHGYILNKKTISMFVVGKKVQAYSSIRTFIKYYKNKNTTLSEESIAKVIASQIIYGIGRQRNCSLTIEVIERHLDMTALSVYAIIHVMLVNISYHISYHALKKGISFVRDLSGYRIRFWNDRKLFLSTKLIHSIFPVAMVVLVDPPFMMNGIFRTLLNATSKSLSNIVYTVKRSSTFEKNKFQKIVWSDVVWEGKCLPELRKKFPYMRLSKIFGGNNDHLLKMVPVIKCIIATVCLECKNDFNYDESSSNELSTVLSIDLEKITEDEKDSLSSSSEGIYKTDCI